MATQTANISLGSKQSHGLKNTSPTPPGGTADVAVTITVSPNLSRSDVIEAAKAAADQFGLK